MVADIVAWANSHGCEPKGTVLINLADRLNTIMLDRFK